MPIYLLLNWLCIIVCKIIVDSVKCKYSAKMGQYLYTIFPVICTSISHRLSTPITSLITYYVLSMEHRFIISLEIFMWKQIRIADYIKNCVSATGKMDISSIHQVSFHFVYTLYVAKSMCWLCVQLV